MKFLIVLAVCLAGVYSAPNYGYSSVVPEIRVTSYDAPAVKSGYEAPVVKSSYEAPALKSSYYSAPLPEIRKTIPIVRFNLNDDNYGTFNFDSVSGDGTHVTEEGHLKNLGDPEGPVSVMSGSYSFVSDDGKTYTTAWVADEQGFRASGEHLPTPPPIPVEHLRTPVLSSYEAPVRMAYEAPVVRSSYAAPALRTQTYEAPAIRVVASGY